MAKSDMIILRGIAHPPTSRDDDYYGVHFRWNEMGEASKALKGNLVFLDHQINLGAVGRVIYAKVNDAGAIEVNIAVSGVTERGKETIRGMMTGEYRALSISTLTDLPNDHPSGLHEKLTPFEISICGRPGREGSNIQGFAHNNGKMYIFEKWDKLLSDEAQKETEEFPFTVSPENPSVLESKHDAIEDLKNKKRFDSSNSRIQFAKSEDSIETLLSEEENKKTENKKNTNQPNLPFLFEKLFSTKRNNNNNIKMNTDNAASTIAAGGAMPNAMDPRIQEIMAEMGCQSVDDFVNFHKTGLEQIKQEEQAKQAKINEQFAKTFAPLASVLGASESDLNGLGMNAKVLFCNYAANVEAKDKDSTTKTLTLKESLDKSLKDNEALNQRVNALEAKLKNQNVLPYLNPGYIAAAAVTPALQQQTVVPNTAPVATVMAPANQSSAVAAPAANTPIAAGKRTAGLIPRYEEPSIFDGGYTQTVSGQFAYKRLREISQGKDAQWKNRTDRPQGM